MEFNKLVDEERERQDKKWGEQNHSPAIWLAILGEEFGEVSTTVISTEWHPEMQSQFDMEKELIQVAAVCKAMWECGKRNGWL